MERSTFSAACVVIVAGCGTAAGVETPSSGTSAMAAPSLMQPAPSDAAPMLAVRATPAADSGARAAPAAGSGTPTSANADTCPDRYTFAARATVDMSWPETVGYFAGRGALQAWTKITFTRTATGTTTEVAMCGVALPVVTTTPLLDGVLLANDIPVASFDLPTTPKSVGSLTETSGQVSVDTGVLLLGAALSDPKATWPTRSQLMAADHDADGKPGVTAIPKSGGAYGLPPADIGQTIFADQVYIAARLSLRLITADSLCAQRSEGAVTPLGFDYTIVGCHEQGGAECKENQVNLLDNNDPAFTLGQAGHWTSVPIVETQTCSEIVMTLPAQ